jgi:hypothetical protein
MLFVAARRLSLAQPFKAGIRFRRRATAEFSPVFRGWDSRTQPNLFVALATVESAFNRRDATRRPWADILPALKGRAGAPESACGQRGASPLQVNALRPVTDCNCDAVMRGGEQQEVNDQSVG